MRSIKNIFWNEEQHRLRAWWRLSIQAILLLFFLLGAQIVVGILAAFGMLLGWEPALETLTDLQAIQQLMVQAPWVMMLLQLSMTVAITLSVWVSGRILDRRSFAGFGLRLSSDWWRDLGFGLLLGAVLMLLIFLVQLAAGWVSVTETFSTREPEATFLVAILPPLITFLAVGFHEELWSRGYQLRNLAEGLNWSVIGPRGAIILATVATSGLFGLLHALNPNATAISTLYLSVAGIFLAAGYLVTGELAIPVGLHITWNFFQGNVFGFPVSGTDFTSATVLRIEQSGPDVWTGGAFGPEAGFLGLAAMLLGILLTVLWVRWRYGTISLHLPLAQTPERTEPGAESRNLTSNHRRTTGDQIER